VRLNRYISSSGYTSRRKGEALIREGHVAVKNVTAIDPAFKVNPETDKVTLDGSPLVINPEKSYYIMNKPTGVIVSRGDTHSRVTVYDILREELRTLFPVGRLDADTSGALLFTNDGDLAYRLTHPSFGVEKLYRAEVSGKVTAKDIRRIKEGIMLEDGPSAPAIMTILESSKNVSIVEITMHEGRKRQVRRMLDKINHPVKKLERISFGGITTDKISHGTYRELIKSEIERLKKTVSLFKTGNTHENS